MIHNCPFNLSQQQPATRRTKVRSIDRERKTRAILHVAYQIYTRFRCLSVSVSGGQCAGDLGAGFRQLGDVAQTRVRLDHTLDDAELLELIRCTWLFPSIGQKCGHRLQFPDGALLAWVAFHRDLAQLLQPDVNVPCLDDAPSAAPEHSIVVLSDVEIHDKQVKTRQCTVTCATL